MNNFYNKVIIFILILSLFLVSWFQFNHSPEISDMAYVIALGLDVGDTNNIKLSLQFASQGGGSSDSTSSENSSSTASDSIVNTIECSSISSGINLFNSYLSKEINLSHCKVLVISEELASQGISEYIYTLMNNIQFNTDANVIISKNGSEDFLKASKPVLEKMSAKYYEIIPTSSEYTGYTQNITLIDFFSSYLDTASSPVAILGSINNPSTQEEYAKEIVSYNNSNNTSPLDSSEKDSSYIAGETPIDSKKNIENIGLAVFNKDTFVGELNAMQSLCHLIMVNELKSGQIRIPSPFREGEYIDLSIRLAKNTDKKVTLENGTPYIECSIYLTSRILSMDENSENLNKETIKKIEDYTNKYLENNISNYLYKTSKEYNTDIDGFGNYARKYFTFWQDWQDYNWINNYKNAFFKVTVYSNIKSSYLLMES